MLLVLDKDPKTIPQFLVDADVYRQLDSVTKMICYLASEHCSNRGRTFRRRNMTIYIMNRSELILSANKRFLQWGNRTPKNLLWMEDYGKALVKELMMRTATNRGLAASNAIGFAMMQVRKLKSLKHYGMKSVHDPARHKRLTRPPVWVNDYSSTLVKSKRRQSPVSAYRAWYSANVPVDEMQWTKRQRPLWFSATKLLA